MVFKNDLLSSKKMKRPGKYMNAGGPLVRNAQEMNREEYNSAQKNSGTYNDPINYYDVVQIHEEFKWK